jgi:hypothetical protein
MIEVLCAETVEPNALPERPECVFAARIGLIACSCEKDNISWLDVQLNYVLVLSPSCARHVQRLEIRRTRSPKKTNVLAGFLLNFTESGSSTC